MTKITRQGIKNVAGKYCDLTDMQKTFAFIRPFIWRRRMAYFMLLFLLLIDIALTIGFAWFFGQITDAAIRSDFPSIKWLIPLGILLTLFSITANFTSIYFESIATAGVKKDLNNLLLNHILRLPAEQASKNHSGELMSHFTTDIHSLDGIIGSRLINIIRMPFIYIVIFIYLSHINLSLSLFSLSISPIAAVSGVVFGLILRKNSRLIFSLIGKINTLLSETFHGSAIIRSFTLEKQLFRKYKSKNEALYQLEMKNAKLQGLFNSGGQMISSATYLTSLCVGAYFVSKGTMTAGALLTFVNLVNHLVYPLTGLAGQWAGFQRSAAAVERIQKVLEQPVNSIELPSFIKNKTDSKSIEIDNITFSYEGSKQVFKEFSLTIPAGKVVALVGPSGGGKSTLLKLIHGFYEPQIGQILFNGMPADALSISELRSGIAYVPQETFLFGGTIRENLMIARPDLTAADMVHASIRAKIHEFILSLPNGYDTEIGESGIKLSGGQKQRVAIARAILKDAPILLLDEATSALDSETEHHVKLALDQLMENRTTLVIAHRLSTIQNADIILVIDHGKVIQSGSHESLINRPGLYRKLHQSVYKDSISLEKKGGLVLEQSFDSSIV